MTLVEAANTSFPPSLLEDLAESARNYIGAAKAPATVKVYRAEWAAFEAWCAHHGLDALPADPRTVAMHLADVAGVLAASTIQRRLTVITQAHRTAGHETPVTASVVRETWRGIRRTFGTASEGKAPIRTKDLRAMVTTLDDSLLGVRNRALLVLGFAGAFRRSELVALDVDDVTETDDGLVVRIRRSKTDQEAEGARLGVPWGSDPSTCPVRAVRAWLGASGIEAGPLFRPIERGRAADRRLAAKQVYRLVKRASAAAGLDPERYGAHSLRAGLITSAVEAGAHERDVMRHSRHRSVAVFRGYVRDVGLFQENAAAAVGL